MQYLVNKIFTVSFRNIFSCGTSFLLFVDKGTSKAKETRKGPYIRPNRMKVTCDLPTADELVALKQRKRVSYKNRFTVC